MAAGRIYIKHIFPDETGKVVWTIRKTSNLLTLVAATFYDGTTTLTNQTKFVYNPPHTEKVLILTDIDPTTFLVTPYRSADGVSLDEELPLQLVVDASTGAQYTTTKYEYIVNRGYSNLAPVVTGTEVWNDPVSGQNTLRDERLLNQQYWIEERGTGILMESEITDRSDAGGGFDFATSGKNFEAGGVYLAIVQNRQDAQIVQAGGGDYNEIVSVPTDVVFNQATMNGKVLVAAYAGANKILTVTMANLALMANCKFKMQAHGGTQRYFALQLDAGDTVPAYGMDLNIIYLGKGEVAEFLIKDNVLYINSPLTGYEKLGQRIWGDKVELNTVRADGTVHIQAEIARLMQFIDAGVTTVSEGSSGGQWSFSTVIGTDTVYPNKGYYARNDVPIAPTIRVPDMRNQSIRALLSDSGDGQRTTQGAGGYQHNEVKSHGHSIATTNSAASSSDDADPVRGSIGGTANTRGGAGTSKTIGMTGGVETRDNNIGMIALIRI